MKKLKLFMLITLLGCSIFSIQANTRAVEHCSPFINLKQLSGQFGIYESVNPPSVNKKMTGTYTCVDVNGLYTYQNVSGSITTGQLSKTYYASSNYQSYKGVLGYYYNNIFQGSITEYY